MFVMVPRDSPSYLIDTGVGRINTWKRTSSWPDGPCPYSYLLRTPIGLTPPVDSDFCLSTWTTLRLFSHFLTSPSHLSWTLPQTRNNPFSDGVALLTPSSSRILETRFIGEFDLPIFTSDHILCDFDQVVSLKLYKWFSSFNPRLLRLSFQWFW